MQKNTGNCWQIIRRITNEASSDHKRGQNSDRFCPCFLRTQTWDYVIGADKGVIFCHKNQIMPTHIVGDFDSAGETEYEYFQKNTDVPIKRLNPVKDYTDTDVALRLALELGAEEITILGGTGARIDHTAANVRILFLALQKRCAGISSG